MKKNYVIIGSGSTIASSLLPLLHSEDAQLYTVSRSSQPEGSARHVEMDILEDEWPENFLPDSVDGLVYFPGTVNLRPFKALKKEDFQKDFEINVLGAVRSVQWVLKKLTEGSSIVFYSTIAVGVGMPYHSSIAIAKGGIEGLARSLAAELAPKTRVNCIAPSLTNTKLSERFINSDSRLQASRERHPLKSIGQPGEIAEMTRYLLSSNARWITGQTIHIDGGLSTLNP